MTIRLGAIDIGTNSIHLLVAEIGPEGEVQVIERDRFQAELGRGGFDDRHITDEAFERGLEALRSFKTSCDSLGVNEIRCSATSAVREADNGVEFCSAVQKQTGIRVRVISGFEEARLIYLGTRGHLDLARGRVLLLDLGGGSCEFVLCDAEQPILVESLPLGHIRLAERFHLADPMTEEERRALKQHVRGLLKPLAKRVHGGDFATLVGSSGAVRNLARMTTVARGGLVPEHDHGLVLRKTELGQLIVRFLQTSRAQMGEIDGMNVRRRRTAPTAAIVIREVMRIFDKKEIVTSERSLRDGIVEEWILRHRPEIALLANTADPRRRSVLAVVDRYNARRKHSEQVAAFALQLFDTTAPLHQLRIDDRRTLEFASWVHDVGHHVSSTDHHKHGQYLIRHTRMPGFTAPEIELIALLVRFHRGGRPKSTHPEFASLDAGAQRRALVLAGILRVADALDRGQTQNLAGISFELADGTLHVRGTTHHDPGLELWAARQRRSLLEKVLGVKVEISISRDQDVEHSSGSEAPAASSKLT